MQIRLHKHRRRFDSRPICIRCHGTGQRLVSTAKWTKVGQCPECSGTGIKLIDLEQNTGVIKNES